MKHKSKGASLLLKSLLKNSADSPRNADSKSVFIFFPTQGEVGKLTSVRFHRTGRNLTGLDSTCFRRNCFFVFLVFLFFFFDGDSQSTRFPYKRVRPSVGPTVAHKLKFWERRFLPSPSWTITGHQSMRNDSETRTRANRQNVFVVYQTQDGISVRLFFFFFFWWEKFTNWILWYNKCFIIPFHFITKGRAFIS